MKLKIHETMKILISDSIDTGTFEIFNKEGLSYKYDPEISSEELTNQVHHYSALIVRSRTKVTKEVIAKGKKLKVVARAGTGVDNIDLEACKAGKIAVVNSPDANSQAVAELTVCLILCLLRNVCKADVSMKKGLWEKKMYKGEELAGKKVGIIGWGNVGEKVGRILEAFGAKVKVFSRSYKTCGIEELMKTCDIVTVHLALNRQTSGLINSNLLKLLKPDSYIINTSRGQIVNEEALFKLLEEGRIKGAALDVYSIEPLPKDSKWRKLSNVILTPHIGASTTQALQKASQTVVEDVVRVLKGRKALNSVF